MRGPLARLALGLCVAALVALAWLANPGAAAESVRRALPASDDSKTTGGKGKTKVVGANGSSSTKNTWHLSMPTKPLKVTTKEAVRFAWKGSHGVSEVPSSSFSSCSDSGSTTIAPVAGSGDVVVGPLAAGTYFYICALVRPDFLTPALTRRARTQAPSRDTARTG